MQAGPGRQHSTHRVEQGAAEPKNTLFHTELEIWSVACWGDSHGVGRKTPVPGGWNRMGLGWLRGRGREAGAPSLAHSVWELLWQLCPLTRDRGQCRCRFNTTPHPGPGARSKLGGTGRLQREQGPGCTHSSPLLRAGWHERPGMEQQPFPSARQEHHGHTHGTGQAGHPPPATTHRTPAGRTGAPSACGVGCGAAGARNGLSSTSSLCGDPTGVRVLPVQDGGCGVGGALPWHRALPPSPSLSSAEDTQVTNTTQPSPRQLAQSWEDPRLPKPV